MIEFLIGLLLGALIFSRSTSKKSRGVCREARIDESNMYIPPTPGPSTHSIKKIKEKHNGLHNDV